MQSQIVGTTAAMTSHQPSGTASAFSDSQCQEVLDLMETAISDAAVAAASQAINSFHQLQLCKATQPFLARRKLHMKSAWLHEKPGNGGNLGLFHKQTTQPQPSYKLYNLPWTLFPVPYTILALTYRAHNHQHPANHQETMLGLQHHQLHFLVSVIHLKSGSSSRRKF